MKKIVKGMFDTIKKITKGMFNVIVFISKILATIFLSISFLFLLIICFPFYIIYWLYKWSHDLNKGNYEGGVYTNLFKDYFIANTIIYAGVKNNPNTELYLYIKDIWMQNGR